MGGAGDDRTLLMLHDEVFEKEPQMQITIRHAEPADAPRLGISMPCPTPRHPATALSNPGRLAEAAGERQVRGGGGRRSRRPAGGPARCCIWSPTPGASTWPVSAWGCGTTGPVREWAPPAGAALEMADNWLNLQRVELTVYTDNQGHWRSIASSVSSRRAGPWLRLSSGEYVDALYMARIRP